MDAATVIIQHQRHWIAFRCEPLHGSEHWIDEHKMNGTIAGWLELNWRKLKMHALVIWYETFPLKYCCSLDAARPKNQISHKSVRYANNCLARAISKIRFYSVQSFRAQRMTAGCAKNHFNWLDSPQNEHRCLFVSKWHGNDPLIPESILMQSIFQNLQLECIPK